MSANRDRIRKHARRVRYRDPPLRGRLEVNIIESDRVIREYLTLLPSRIQHLGIDLVGEKTQYRIIWLCPKRCNELCFCKNAAIGVYGNLISLLVEHFGPAIWDFSRDVDIHRTRNE